MDQQTWLFLFGAVAVLFVIVVTIALISLVRTRPYQKSPLPLEEETPTIDIKEQGERLGVHEPYPQEDPRGIDIGGNFSDKTPPAEKHHHDKRQAL
ncbi:MAG: hypothetical protein J2P36_37575 [Ktedonobacteraceae bacterium]|nr:hypothetical protein [Ktedonobacteraceae bacterium]